MSLVKRSVLLVVALGLMAAGCSNGETGTPAPATNTSTSGTSEATTPASTSSSSGDPLATFDSCKALTAIAGQFVLTEIKEVDKQECGAEYGAKSGVSVSIKAWPDLAVKDVKGGPNAEFSDITIGSRKARLVKKAFSSSACAIAVEVSATSRVDFASSANVSLDDACDAATKIATAVEPTLPK